MCHEPAGGQPPEPGPLGPGDLLDRGADPNVVGGYGRTALYAIMDILNEDWSTLPNRKAEDPLPSLDIVNQLLARGGRYAELYETQFGPQEDPVAA